MRTDEYIALIEKGKLSEAEKVRQSTIPKKLIKFIWLDGSKTDQKKFETLKKDQIWFSAKRFLNDPYEFKGMMVDRQKLKNAGYPEKIIDQYQKLLDFEQFGISCLSANEADYLPMWAYYANNHRGFCVEYEVIKKENIHEVFYEPERIKVASLVVNYGLAAEKAIKQKKQTEEADLLCTILIQNLFMKAKQWKHEKEYRIVSAIHNQTGGNASAEEVGLRTNRIIAGTECDMKNIEQLNEISNSLGLGNVYRSYLHPEKYTVKIEQL